MSYYTKEDLVCLGAVSDNVFGDFGNIIGVDKDSVDNKQYANLMEAVIEDTEDPIACLGEFLVRYLFTSSTKEEIEKLIFEDDISSMPLYINIEEKSKYNDLPKTIIARWRLEIGK